MAEKTNPDNKFMDEKNSIIQQGSGKYLSADNNIVPRTHSTPLVDPTAPKKTTKLKLQSSGFTPVFNPTAPSFNPSSLSTSTVIPVKQEPLITIPETDLSKSVIIPSSEPKQENTSSSSSNAPVNMSQSTVLPQTGTASTTVKKERKPLKLASTAQEFVAKGNLDKLLQELPADNTQTQIPVQPPQPENLPGDWGKKPVKVEKPSPTKKVSAAETIGAKKPGEFKPSVEETKAAEAEKEEEKAAEPEKQPEQQFINPIPTVPKEVTISWSRKELLEMLERRAEEAKQADLPEKIRKLKEREIVYEEGDYKKQKPKYIQPQGPATTIKREDSKLQTAKTQQEPIKTATGQEVFKRREETAEEKAKKQELAKNVNVWISSIKTDDPDKLAEKKIKYNLNIITPDNFDIIKEDILKVACEKLKYTKRVAKIIIENAWTQKHYANTYAKLCDFLGKSDKLNFDKQDAADAKKKKNDFKIQIMKKIQKVFEDKEDGEEKDDDEDEDGPAQKKKQKAVADMTKEELMEHFDRKKKKILGNVCFIGELFLEKFIVIDIVRIIFNTLLKKFLEEYDSYQKNEVKPFNKPHEDNLEGLLKFIEIVGKTVEEKEKTKSPDDKKSQAMVASFEESLMFAHSTLKIEVSLPQLPEDPISLPDIFKILDKVLSEATLSQRLASLIKNLNHRKENNWDNPLYKNRGPKKMDEIHAEYQAEQEEIDRKAQEYYQEERESGYGGKGRGKGGKSSETQYFVSYEPKKVQPTHNDDKQYDTTGYKPKDVEFKPKRGKQQNEPKSGEKKMQISHEQLYADFREVYSDLADIENPEERSEKFIEEVKRIADHVPEHELAGGLLMTFFDGKLNQVNDRIPLCNLMLEKKFFSVDDFVRAFDSTMSKMFDLACDFPHCDEAFAKIYLEFLTKYPNTFDLSSKLSIPEVENEDDEYMLDFHKDFVGRLEELVNKEYESLKATVESDLNGLRSKLKI